MRVFVSRAAVLAAPLVIAACAVAGGGFAVTHTIFHDYRYDPLEVAAGGAPMPVEVRGATPVGVSAGDVVAAMRLPAHVRRETALAKPGWTGPRIVVAFARASGRSLCDPEGSRPEGAAASLTLAGAYCVGDAAYSSAITEARDGNLPNAARNLTRTLLPVFNPERRRFNHRD